MITIPGWSTSRRKEAGSGTGRTGSTDRPRRLSPQEVKAKASRELSASIRGRFSNPDEIRSKVDAVFRANRPLGLKSISTRRTGRAGEFAAFVKASPETIATKFVHEDFKVGIRARESRALKKENATAEEKQQAEQTKARRLGPRRTVQHTSLTASWNGIPLPRMKSAGIHAEDQLSRFILKALKAGRLPKTDKNSLEIQILKSPCSNCKAILLELASAANCSIHLAMLGLYHGEQEKRDPVTGEKLLDPVTKKPIQKSREEKRQQREVSINVLKELRQAGFELSVLNVEKIIEKHYQGVTLDQEELGTIRRKVRALTPIIAKINADSAAAETTVKGT